MIPYASPWWPWLGVCARCARQEPTPTATVATCRPGAPPQRAAKHATGTAPDRGRARLPRPAAAQNEDPTATRLQESVENRRRATRAAATPRLEKIAELPGRGAAAGRQMASRAVNYQPLRSPAQTHQRRTRQGGK